MLKLLILSTLSLFSLTYLPCVYADNIDDLMLKINVQQTQDTINIQKSLSVRGSQTNEITYGDSLKQMYDRFIENTRRFMESMRLRQKQQIQNFKSLTQVNQNNARVIAQSNKLRQDSMIALQRANMQTTKDQSKDLVRRLKSTSVR
jgi:hypothetical protein